MSEPLSLSGVELRRHADPEYPVAGDEFEPYGHQRRLRELFRTEKSFLAVNDSPTGGGKTMSWLAPVVESGEHALAVYPTNALIHDQAEGLETELRNQFPETTLGEDTVLLTVTADTLRTEYAEEFPNATSNGARLRQLLRREVYYGDRQVILLTNPDIFVMMRRSLYGREGNPGSRVRALNEFGTMVVDEFHRADRKEQNTLLFLLDEMYDLDPWRCALSRIVLLSATPTDWLETRFEEGMSAPYHRVTDTDDGPEQGPFSETVTPGWGAVMPPVELDARTASTFDAADELLGEDWEATREFAARPGKTVFILDGIREVEEVYTRLDAELDEQEVVRIDGFHRGDLKEKLARFDVLVSNSAVEVGIDFTVDRLLFSAHDRASFLQRLGRLRTETERQSARCYVPSKVVRALDGLSGAVTRGELTATLGNAYPEPWNRASFDWRYSAAEAYHHLDKRTRDAPPGVGEEIKEEGWVRILAHFGREEGLTRGDLERKIDPIADAIEDTMQWYRGDSLQALVYDLDDEATEPVRSYNLFYLLRHGDVEFFPRAEFEDRVPDEYAGAIESAAPYVCGFCTYNGTIPTNDEGYGRDVTLEAEAEVYGWLGPKPQTADKPRVIDSLSIDVHESGARRLPSIEHLRDGMEDLGLLCYAVDQNSKEARNRYDLGPFFFFHQIQVGEGLCSLATGTDALYLHCAVEDEDDAANGLERFGVDV